MRFGFKTGASPAFAGLLAVAFLSSCGTPSQNILISVSDQKMVLLNKGEPVAVYPVSTSKFGVGDSRGSYKTPLGEFEVARKIGHGAPKGAVFKSRRRTGEVIPVDAPGRDPIVTRILWLRGREKKNRNAYGRYIYIHGTPEERNIGRPASFGCIRMRSSDIVDLFKHVRTGAQVAITTRGLPRRSRKVEQPEPEPVVEPVEMLAEAPPQPPARKSREPAGVDEETRRLASNITARGGTPAPVSSPAAASSSPRSGDGAPPSGGAAQPEPESKKRSRWHLSLDQARRLLRLQKPQSSG